MVRLQPHTANLTLHPAPVAHYADHSLALADTHRVTARFNRVKSDIAFSVVGYSNFEHICLESYY